MREIRTFSWACLCVFGLSLSSGCERSKPSPVVEDSQDRITLDQIGEIYRTYQLMKGTPPNSIKDIAVMERGNPMGVASVRRGDVVIQWGAKLPDTSEEAGVVSSPEILAYQKQVSDQGGFVLLLDRTVRKMTAEEFKAAKKAGKSG